MDDLFQKIEQELRAKAAESVADLTTEKTKLIAEIHLLTAKVDFLKEQHVLLKDREAVLLKDNEAIEADGTAKLKELQLQASREASDFTDRQTRQLEIESQWRDTITRYQDQEIEITNQIREKQALVGAAEGTIDDLKTQRAGVTADINKLRDELNQFDIDVRLKRDAVDQAKLVIDIEEKIARQKLGNLHDVISEAEDQKTDMLSELETLQQRLDSQQAKHDEFVTYEKTVLSALMAREDALDERTKDFETRQVQANRRTVV